MFPHFFGEADFSGMGVQLCLPEAGSLDEYSRWLFTHCTDVVQETSKTLQVCCTGLRDITQKRQFLVGVSVFLCTRRPLDSGAN
jgi:hypothetical protein